MPSTELKPRATYLFLFILVLRQQQGGCHEHQQNFRGPTSRRLKQAEITPRIVGGEATTKGRFPYMCSLKNNNHQHVCGGVLIAPQAVLTAAHCVDSSVDGAVNLNLLVTVGAHNINDNGSVDGVQDNKVMDIKIQQDFRINAIQRGNDIAILILAESSQSQPISLPMRGFTPNQQLLALGWGQGSIILQQIFLEPVSRDECAQSYPGIGANIHCAYSDRGDTCRGDSGGPLIIPDAPDRSISSGSSKFDTLVALTSFGVEPCRGGGSPGGYTLVGPFRDWIDSVIASIGESEPSPVATTPVTTAVEESTDKDGKSALFIASSRGETTVVKSLIATGSNVNLQANSGDSPLHAAAEDGHTDVVKALLAAGADVNAANDKGETALIIACIYGDLDIVMALIDSGANVDVKDNEGVGPLIDASSKNFLDVVQALIAAGADANIETNNGYTPIINAAYEGNTDMVQALLAAGANPDQVANDGASAMQNALSAGFLDVVVILIGVGADVNVMDADGFTPVIAAAYDGNIKALKILLDAGANINASLPESVDLDDGTYPMGTTALHVAVRVRNSAAVKILLEYGADASIRDSQGNTAQDLVPSGASTISGLFG